VTDQERRRETRGEGRKRKNGAILSNDRQNGFQKAIKERKRNCSESKAGKDEKIALGNVGKSGDTKESSALGRGGSNPPGFPRGLFTRRKPFLKWHPESQEWKNGIREARGGKRSRKGLRWEQTRSLTSIWGGLSESKIQEPYHHRSKRRHHPTGEGKVGKVKRRGEAVPASRDSEPNHDRSRGDEARVLSPQTSFKDYGQRGV